MFLFLRAIAGWDWLLDQVGADSIGDPASLPIVLLAAGAAFSVVGLVGSFVSRAFERQADEYGLGLLRHPDLMMDMHRRLHVKNLADLTPSRWRYLQATHPPAAERLAFADGWARAEGFDLPEPQPVAVDVELTGSN
jgi:STE24 endopeptidase